MSPMKMANVPAKASEWPARPVLRLTGTPLEFIGPASIRIITAMLRLSNRPEAANEEWPFLF